MCAGHCIMGTPEVPLVVSDAIQEYKKTKEAVRFLKCFKAWEDIKKVGKNSHLSCEICSKMEDLF